MYIERLVVSPLPHCPCARCPKCCFHLTFGNATIHLAPQDLELFVEALNGLLDAASREPSAAAAGAKCIGNGLMM